MPASFPRLGLLGALCSIVPLLHASEPTTDAALIEKGRYVAQLGDCIACHTGPQGAPMAGGLELKTPMGTIYSTNITPDRETGIGRYSFEEFDRAMRKGVTAEGVNLYPAMPYPSYAKISEEDMRALYAYLMHGVQPVTQANTPSAMSWPFNQRWGLSLWNWAFLDDAPFTPSSDADPVINRGAYLVQGLGHCGACHTPRGIAFQEKAMSEAGRSGQFYLAGETVEQWQALSLRNLWTVEDTVQLLKTGQNRFATVSGSMTDVIHHSTQHFSDDDLLAIASYLKSLPAGKDDLPMPDSERPLAAPVDLYSSRSGLGYAQFCSDCHRKDGSGVPGMFPPLAGNPTVASANPSTLLHITLTGWKTAQTATHSRVYTMPGFAQLEDREIAEILSFVRSSWGNQGSSIDAGQVKKLRQRIEAGNGPATTFVSPRLADMLAAPNAEQVVRGMRLHLETRKLLPANVGNQLNCTSCHLNAGTVADGSPFVGVSAFFPSYAPRAGKVIGLEERINGCFRRSMNGKPLPPDSADMQAMVAYFDWMKNNTRPQDKVAGRGVGKVDPALKPDPENGRKVYARQCAVCHGENGEGLRNSAGEMLFPPLWGDESFNIGAGMARTFTAAAFVKHNMPIGFQERFPLGQGGLSDQDAVDVAEYFSHQPRPDFPDKIKDWPKDKRPLDARY
ncbi:TPA: c-type cytochrome [Pseudomonas aeruginosa]|uniref:c-type cytochrome n=1 Tax=Pseudomonas aeruginosa TaxID=287 RepID=UPI0012DA055E|nr:c-type cytochrome [Pseudomonas aeruginosa]EKV4054046.1 c-type cytochrome [Pseudomonas aeruginosa]MUI77829.1 c-type cytochrome [Pseudomonas aeruginosa]HBP6072014.1 cytochrome C [Pseudomonas aeruginosa]HBP6507357.1 cytochrome C [Pseudomonas aeruginosa]HCF7100061.1 c-type cytochrome [Pseudomonas aeruginosa]